MAEAFENFVGGRWCASESGRTMALRNPATSEVLGLFQDSTEADVDAALGAAQEAFGPWRRLTPARRAEYLIAFKGALRDAEDELARIITLEMGRPLKGSYAAIQRSYKVLDYFAGEGVRMGGRTVSSEREGVTAFSTREPLGVVSLITPWNFPLVVPVWKLAPALVAGNTCLWKAASSTPWTGVRIMELLEQCGLPAGVVNYVTGSGSRLGKALVDDARVRAVSFTGSTEVGRGIKAAIGGRLTRVQLEMGGKNPFIVWPDADMDLVMTDLQTAAFTNTGQRCTSAGCVIVHEDVHDAFLERLLDLAASLKVGSGLEPDVDMGPIHSEDQLEMNLSLCRVGVEEGARLLCGGERLTGPAYDKGRFMGPTVLAGATPEMRVAREEIFGPVLVVLKVRAFDEAITVCNVVDYGLAASLYTNDLACAFQFMRAVEAGMLHVNSPSVANEMALPFGGVKESGFGIHELGAAIEFFTETRSIYIRTGN